MQIPITRSFLYVLILLPIVLFCLFLWHFALDIPQGDDFELILNFLSDYVSKAATLQQKFALITEQWVEHRLAYTRIVVLFQYLLTGQVSFYLIIILGNLSLIGILFICWRQLQSAGYSLYYLFPISLLLFQPCYSYDGLLWPAATLAYNSVSFFAILTIHWLSNRRGVYFWLATISAIVCVYTFGNGVLIFVAGACVLLIQKRQKELVLWSGITILIIFIYFSNYQHYGNRNNPFHNLTNHSFYIFINFLVFLGSALNWDERWIKAVTFSDLPSIIAGAGVLIAFCFLLFTNLRSWIRVNSSKTTTEPKQDQYTVFLLGSLLFFVLTGILLCVSRGDKDMVYAHTNRYRINSVAGLIIAYCAILRFFKVKPLFYALITTTVGVVFILSFFHFYSIFAEYKRAFTAAQYNWVTTHQWFIYRDTSYWEESSKIIMKNVERNLNYQITTSPFSNVTIKEEALPNVRVERTDSTKLLTIDGNAAIANPFSKADDYYIAFKNMSTSTTYLVAAQYDRRSIRLVMMGEDYYYPNFHITLPYRHFPTGTYRIGVAHSKSNELDIKWQPFVFNTVKERNP